MEVVLKIAMPFKGLMESLWYQFSQEVAEIKHSQNDVIPSFFVSCDKVFNRIGRFVESDRATL